jgi:hypothetical protein
MARASLCTVLHVEGLVPVVAARASPCTLHVEGLVTVFAARASPCTLHVGELVTVFAARTSPCTLHVGGLVTVFAARASFSPSERLGGRVPSLCGDTKCVPSLSGDTRSTPQRVAGLVVHLGDDVDSTPRVSLPGRYTEEQEISSSKVGEDAPATARRGIEVVPALRGGTRVAARARSLCDWLHVEGLGRGVLSLSACTEIAAAPDPESEEGQQAAAVAEGGERQRSPCVREQLFLREQKPSFIEVVSMLVCSSVAFGAQLEAAAGPESEPAPQAAPGSISERDQRAPPLPYGMSGEIDAVDNCEER